ncbi:PREDICTED: uncharacterized protein LOC109478849 [Branchiostoma belcheri]|uniref:Uncharacterized protein LOC109478849 n=1 Tax=Branchiostoma belcheri TaxID=7741 RepID=A0A6P4Z3Z3_BRABE|nr:PREDICTED: uncharacterized protein LOC109478849 [Branchiostoma belcheri]
MGKLKATKRKPEMPEKGRDESNKQKMAQKMAEERALEIEKFEIAAASFTKQVIAAFAIVLILIFLGAIIFALLSRGNGGVHSPTAEQKIAAQKCAGKTGVPEADMLEEEIEELEKSEKTTEGEKEEGEMPPDDTEPKSEPKEMPTEKPTKATPSPKLEKKSPDSEDRLPEKIREFEPTILDRLKVRNVSVDGRQLRYREVKPTKDVDTNVRVYLFDNFLTARECEGLMGAHTRHVQEAAKHDPIICFDSIKTLRNHLKDAGVKVKVSSRDFTEGTKCLNGSFSSQLKQHFHWSYSTSFYPGESKFSATFERRVAAATGLKVENGGKFQITSYAQGIGYKSHTDCVVGSRDQRDRFATILVYLQDVPEGGETKFTELGIAVKPTKGMAIVWNNMTPDGNCDPTSLHDASKVKKGHKFIIQRWYYYKSFYSLGKRSPEPTLPARETGQPRVSCDEYEHGSCRWYDEWNYDHIVEYEAQKLSLA